MEKLEFGELGDLLSSASLLNNNHAGLGCGDTCNGVICGGSCLGGWCGYSMCPA